VAVDTEMGKGVVDDGEGEGEGEKRPMRARWL
jgi:hypothetical protein